MSGYSSDWVGRTLSEGRYRVEAKLGEGGMGFVYKVWDRNLDTDVVVKVPRRSMLDDPEFSQRFSLEIRSLVKLSHPHIVKVTDVGEHEGLPFAVMQYLSGGTLDERQQYGPDGRPSPAPPGSLATWLPGLAAALDFIHRKNYIHRDVKPANILFDTDGHPYLSDFGVAKVISDVEASAKRAAALTGVGIVLGTPEYMAPELIMGGQFDGRVDQYALAATAYEILCGRKPFTGDTPTAILVRQTTLDAPPMVELPPAGSEAITRVILKGLAKKPDQRHANCVEFASALVAALAKAEGRSIDRLACPSCGVGFAVPADLANFKGKKSKCQVCKAPFRFANDGLSLIPIDPNSAQTPSGGVDLSKAGVPSTPPQANRTVKLGAMPEPPSPVRADTPQANRTVKLEAMPNATPPGGMAAPRADRTRKIEAMSSPPQSAPASAPRADRTQKLEAIPTRSGPSALDDIEPAEPLSLQDEQTARRSPLPWVIGTAVLAVVGILGVVFALPSKEGTVQLRLESPLTGASLSIDGERLDPDRLKNPLTLSVGTHRLEAESKGYAPLRADLPIASGTNPPFPVNLTPLAPLPRIAAAPSQPAEAVPPPSAAGTPEPSNSQLGMGPSIQPNPHPSSPARGANSPAPTPPIALAGGEKSPDEPAEKAEAEVPGREEKHDPDFEKPGSRNTKIKADVALKQIVSDPESYLDRVVSPSDLIMVNTRVVRGKGLAVKTRSGSYQASQKPGTAFVIVIKPELAGHLRDQVNSNTLVEGDYPAMVKMKVTKDPTDRGAFLGVVEWIEFLIHIDPRPISFKSSQYHKAFMVDNITETGANVILSRAPDEWRKRLPAAVVTNVRNAYVNEFKINRAPEYGMWAEWVMKNLAAHSRFFHKRILDMIR